MSFVHVYEWCTGCDLVSFVLLHEWCTVYDLVSLFLREVNSFLDDLPIRCFGKIHNDWLALQEVNPDAKAELLACVKRTVLGVIYPIFRQNT